ncbi:MAG: PAS domain S-box protein [Alphaproteobacteria bacterium]|nr:PAS domain S-box protein [Alphaproteobacteria bacterium]MBU1552301.1 PAS domain S-box protein [Alphaproteobacteria bacterium]MBU2336790.1 PAS domain S-box protein [Alphaproteobacteria bacterium]MBU2388471.1 PAS domain S-box protein [Alphaproteobacteria bacterium]
MGRRIRSYSWADTSSESPGTWPTALSTLVSVMLASNQAMFVVWGPEQLLLYNDAYSQILASKHPEALGRNFLDVWEEIRTDLTPIVEQAYAGKPVHMDDIKLLMHRKGYPEEVHFSFSYTPVRDEAGHIAGIFCPCNEITGQVLAERRLRESEARAKGVLDGMAESFALLDREFRIIDLNVEALRLDSRPREALIGRSHWDAYPGSESSELGSLYTRAMAQRVPVKLEHLYTWPDGRETWMETRAYPIDDGLAVFFRDVTEQKKSDAAAQETAERYRLAVRATNDAIWDWHFATNDVLWNEALETAYGHKPADVQPTGEWWIDHIHPDDRPRIDDSIHAVIDSSDESWTDEYRFRRADGTYAEVLDRGHVIRNDAGQAIRMIGAMLDLTEQRRSQAALRESEERYRTLFASIESGFCVVEVKFERPDDRCNYRVVEANPAFYRQTGFPGSIFGQWLREAVPDLEEHWFEIYGRVAKTGVAERFEQGSDALERWFDVYAFRLGEPDNHRVAILFNDISARRKAEERLRQLNNTLEAEVVARTAERDRIWETSPDLMVVIDFAGYFRRVSPTWTALLGYRHDELVGHHVNEFVVTEDHAETVAAYELAAHGGRPRIENRYRHKDGTLRWISWMAAPAGDVTYAIGRDVTAEKAAAAELEQAQAALRQSQKMEAVGQLTGGLAHDFNNLLAGISGSLELMKTRIAQGRLDDVERYLVAAQGATKRAAALTHRLLAFSRRQTLDPKPTNVGSLIGGMEDLIRRTVGPSISVESVAGGGIWSVLVDPNQLENALLNLCINARDAMPDGGRITIETCNRWLDDRAARTRDLAPGQYVSLCVSDDGAGMSPAVIEKAFDPFFTTKPIGMGTGLGLSMIYGFARQSGGGVRIYSEVGQGTMVCIYLPRHLGSEDPEEKSPQAAALERAKGGEAVLVVDDEPLVRMLVVDALEELGYIPVEAGDGPSAMNVLQSETRIDLLITDVGLPNGMNGRQVADAARQLRPGLNVLFITGYAENAVLNHGHLEHGMQVITKPFDMSELSRRIQTMMSEDNQESSKLR